LRSWRHILKFGNREFRNIAVAPFRKAHYVALAGILKTYKHPFDACARYHFGLGKYPATVSLCTPIGDIQLVLYTFHDIVTVNEIFCRHDYRAGPSDKVIVDFGSNIGISAAYFLSRSADSYAYLYEPVPQNVRRLRQNLRPFERRCSVSEVAVGLRKDQVEFGCEESGRYGGVGLKTGTYISVECLDANEVLSQILAKHARINILKIDIESLEKQVFDRIPTEMLKRVDKIYVECRFEANPLEETHFCRQYTTVAQFAIKHDT
jgi:FkbM family methyltransferase